MTAWNNHLHQFTSSDPFAPLRPVDGELPETFQWVPAEFCEEPTDLRAASAAARWRQEWPARRFGGLPGYEEILDVLADASREDHVEVSEWVADVTGSDGPFEPSFLDIAATNRPLAGSRVRAPGQARLAALCK
jgi:hypothetical protein